jgi:hypothetical protein
MMKSPRRPLLMITLAMILMMFLISIATSGTVKNGLNSSQDCAQECGQSYNRMIETCDRLSGDSRDSCRGTAREQYKKCAETCGKGGTGGGDLSGNSNKTPE